MKKLVAAWLAGALVWAGAAMPGAATSALADDDGETGATIAVGLAIAVVAVYGIVSLQNDIETYASAEEAIDRATATAEASPVVVDTIVQRSAFGEPKEDGVMVGWRLEL